MQKHQNELDKETATFQEKAANLLNKMKTATVLLKIIIADATNQDSRVMSDSPASTGINRYFNIISSLGYILSITSHSLTYTPTIEQMEDLMDFDHKQELLQFFKFLESYPTTSKTDFSDIYVELNAFVREYKNQISEYYKKLVNDLTTGLVKPYDVFDITNRRDPSYSSNESALRKQIFTDIQRATISIEAFVSNSSLGVHIIEYKAHRVIKTNDDAVIEMMHLLCQLLNALFYLQVKSQEFELPFNNKPTKSHMKMLLKDSKENHELRKLWHYLKINYYKEHVETRLKLIQETLNAIGLEYQHLIYTTLESLPEKPKTSLFDILKPSDNNSSQTSSTQISIVFDNKRRLSEFEQSETRRLQQEKEQESLRQKEIEESNKQIAQQKEKEKSTKMKKKNQFHKKEKAKKQTATPSLNSDTPVVKAKTSKTNVTLSNRIEISDTVTDASYLLNKKSPNTAPLKKAFSLPKNLDEVENILAQIQGITKDLKEEVIKDEVTIDALIGGFILAFVSLHIFNQNYQGIYPLTKLNFIDPQELKNLRHQLLHQCHHISDEAISKFVKKLLEFNSRIIYFRNNGNLRSQDPLTFNDAQLYKELEYYEKNVARDNDVVILKNYIKLIDKLKHCMKYIESAEQLKLHQPNIYIVISYIFKVNNLAKSFSKEFRSKNPELVSFLSIYRNQVAHQDYSLYDQLFEKNGNLHYEKFFSLVKNSEVILKFANKALSETENLKTKKFEQEVKSLHHQVDYYNPHNYPYPMNPYMFYNTPTYAPDTPIYYCTPLEMIYFNLTNLFQSQDPAYEISIIISEIKKLDQGTLNYLLEQEKIKEVIFKLLYHSEQLKIEDLLSLIQNYSDELITAIYNILYPEMLYSV